jgi:hypothetical protein
MYLQAWLVTVKSIHLMQNIVSKGATGRETGHKAHGGEVVEAARSSEPYTEKGGTE